MVLLLGSFVRGAMHTAGPSFYENEAISLIVFEHVLFEQGMFFTCGVDWAKMGSGTEASSLGAFLIRARITREHNRADHTQK